MEQRILHLDVAAAALKLVSQQTLGTAGSNVNDCHIKGIDVGRGCCVGEWAGVYNCVTAVVCVCVRSVHVAVDGNEILSVVVVVSATGMHVGC